MEKGIRKVSIEELISLSDLFDCTIEYLIGKTDIRNYKLTEPSNTATDNQQVILPIIGTIRAGVTNLSKESIEGYLEVPDYLHGNYVLQVKGDSMIGVGILDGDLAICRESAVPQNGQIIVALRDERAISEVALRFYMNGNGHPYLQAANPAYTDIDYEDGYRTAGTMMALVRKEAPGYHIYKNFISIPGYDEWTEVFELAASTGIKPQRMKSFIEMIKEMGKGK